jgi:hypothetical protein
LYDQPVVVVVGPDGWHSTVLKKKDRERRNIFQYSGKQPPMPKFVSRQPWWLKTLVCVGKPTPGVGMLTSFVLNMIRFVV